MGPNIPFPQSSENFSVFATHFNTIPWKETDAFRRESSHQLYFMKKKNCFTPDIGTNPKVESRVIRKHTLSCSDLKQRLAPAQAQHHSSLHLHQFFQHRTQHGCTFKIHKLSFRIRTHFVNERIKTCTVAIQNEIKERYCSSDTVWKYLRFALCRESKEFRGRPSLPLPVLTSWVVSYTSRKLSH